MPRTSTTQNSVPSLVLSRQIERAAILMGRDDVIAQLRHAITNLESDVAISVRAVPPSNCCAVRCDHGC